MQLLNILTRSSPSKHEERRSKHPIKTIKLKSRRTLLAPASQLQSIKSSLSCRYNPGMPDFRRTTRLIKKGEADTPSRQASRSPGTIRRNDTLLLYTVTSFFYFEFYEAILRSRRPRDPLLTGRPVKST